jgi:uncharacterized membrane protein
MLSRTQKVLLALAAVFYVFAGVNHFLKPGFYLKMMPPYIPWHQLMVQLSGVAEVLGGVGLLIPSTRRAAAWGLVALLVAVFPANIYMATNPVEAGAAAMPAASLYIRLAFQPILIWWVLWCTKPKTQSA